MTSDHPEPIGAAGPLHQLEKIERYPNLNRLRLPGDKPGKPTGLYYAVIKRGRKQFRRSLRNCGNCELKDKTGNLVVHAADYVPTTRKNLADHNRAKLAMAFGRCAGSRRSLPSSTQPD